LILLEGKILHEQGFQQFSLRLVTQGAASFLGVFESEWCAGSTFNFYRFDINQWLVNLMNL
jgi:hypothetical protein